MLKASLLLQLVYHIHSIPPDFHGTQHDISHFTSVQPKFIGYLNQTQAKHNHHHRCHLQRLEAMTGCKHRVMFLFHGVTKLYTATQDNPNARNRCNWLENSHSFPTVPHMLCLKQWIHIKNRIPQPNFSIFAGKKGRVFSKYQKQMHFTTFLSKNTVQVLSLAIRSAFKVFKMVFNKAVSQFCLILYTKPCRGEKGAMVC